MIVYLIHCNRLSSLREFEGLIKDIKKPQVYSTIRDKQVANKPEETLIQELYKMGKDIANSTPVNTKPKNSQKDFSILGTAKLIYASGISGIK